MVNCEVNQIFLGEVAAVQNYGAFVRIPGCSQQGLIHRSQVSSSHIDDVAEILQRGERVWCKVISVSDDGKIGLSMKHVNQGNGTDLDPNGVELQRDMQKKKVYISQQRKTIQLEAVFNTTCTKCGTHGHLAKDCFVPPNGKKYELIPEIEDLPPVPKIEPEPEPEPEPEDEQEDKKVEKKHKTKKSKKRKKSKKSKHHTDDSSSEDEQTTKKRKKKRSKDYKQKKKKRNSSTSDTDSSNSSSQDIKSHKRKHSERSEVRAKKCKHSKEKRMN